MRERDFAPLRIALAPCCLALCFVSPATIALSQSPAPNQPAANQPGTNPQTQPSPAPAEEKPQRIYEGPRFARIYFKSGDPADIKELTEPLPQKPKPLDKLKVDVLEVGEREVEWKDIERIATFEELILEEANAHVAKKDFDIAYDYFLHLEALYPKTPGLSQSVESFLFEDAKSWYVKQKYDQALNLLNETYARNPMHPGLENALSLATGKLIERTLANNDYAATRRLVQNLAAKFPDAEAVVSTKGTLIQRAESQLNAARMHAAAGRYGPALDAVRESTNIWPLPEARQLWAETHQKYPRVVIGVTLPGSRAEANGLIDWAARRSRRLVHRSLLEFTGYGPQGGVYQCPIGEMEKLDLGERLLFRVRPNIPWSEGGGMLTAQDLAIRLLTLTNPNQPEFRPDWADLLGGVQVRDVFELEVALRRSHVHPDAMLQITMAPWNARALPGPPAAIGPFIVESQDENEVRYKANQSYFAITDSQPKQIVERYYKDQRKAIAALKNGELALLDRILPWEVETVRAYDNISVARYAVPTIHCLVPNRKKDFLKLSAFRRAILFALDREEILTTQLLVGNPSGAGQVISGPFPRKAKEAGIDDPLGYGYNDLIPVERRDLGLALTLTQLAQRQLAKPKEPAPQTAATPSAGGANPTANNAARPGTPGNNPSAAAADPQKFDEDGKPLMDIPPVPKLVLAHPPHELARVACRSIKRQLELVKIPVELKELPAQNPTAPVGDWDLLYTELAMWEPVVDARRLLGPGGIVGECSPYMELALRQLESSENWKQARQKLLDVHRLAAEDLTVIPLWQLFDFFAHQRGLEGVGANPVMLYQQIEAWRVPAWFSTETL